MPGETASNPIKEKKLDYGDQPQDYRDDNDNQIGGEDGQIKERKELAAKKLDQIEEAKVDDACQIVEPDHLSTSLAIDNEYPLVADQMSQDSSHNISDIVSVMSKQLRAKDVKVHSSTKSKKSGPAQKK